MACQSAFCDAGSYFNITATGTPANLSISLCLNGKAALSCQNYNASATILNVSTLVTNHTYPNAGIRINTPGHVVSGCTPTRNGYCLFSVSDTKTAIIPVTTPSCQAGVISFTPSNITVNNPLTGSNAPQEFTVSMTMCNSQGQALIPSAANPIHVDVYGAREGVISPTSTTTSTGTLTFTYNGQSFPNNISINAWIRDSTNNGAALGVTQVLQQNKPPICSYGEISYNVPLKSTLPEALQVDADVGYNTNDPTTTLTPFTLDTGSLGVVVPASELPQNSHVIGPGASGVKYYDSSGNTYSGNYYLAPVRIQTNNGTVQTIPILVLGIDKAYCTGPTTRSCYTNSSPPAPDLHYMGVGFNRNSTTTNDLFNSPTANAFLHLNNANNGTDIGPGYNLTPSDATITGLSLGITDTSDYQTVNLVANPSVPGDFSAQPGCYSFTDFSPAQQFCGTALLDIGIDYMFIDLPKSQWPAGTFDSVERVPVGTAMSILMGPISAPAMQYSYMTNNTNTYPAAPNYVQWIDSTTTDQIFVNTGRRPLYKYNYFYEGQCGQVGFKPLH